MAERKDVVLIDDLEGTKCLESDNTAGIETVTFMVDGVTYSMELTAEHAQDFRDKLTMYVLVARREVPAPKLVQSKKSDTPTRTRPKMDPVQSKAIREWARTHGWPELSERGRIPAEVMDAYNGTPTAPQSVSDASQPEEGEQGLFQVAEPADGQDSAADDPSDDDVMRWWTVDKKHKEPKNGKVSGLMRHQYKQAHSAA